MTTASIGFMSAMCLFLSTGTAQISGTSPAFEEAAIKPSPAMGQALPLLTQGKLKAGINIDGARVDMGFVTLTDMIVEAYKIKAYQISGPDWLLMERFDVQAKLPDGATLGQVPQMLRSLLADRFGMKTHTELRMLSVYALVVGKDGAKLSPSTLTTDPEQEKGLTTLTPSSGGRVSSSGGPAGPTQMTMGPDGMELILLKTKMSGLSDLLTLFLSKPVIDRTNLTDYFRVTLNIPQEDMRNVARAYGVGGRGSSDGNPADPNGSSMFQAVERLGLRLDSRKEQIETLVIDQIQKLPTAN